MITKRGVYPLALLILLGLIAAIPSAQAGELIDFLPEVELARSLGATWLPQGLFNSPAFSSRCGNVQTSDALVPQHLLYDQNGTPYTLQEITRHFVRTFCHFINWLNSLDRSGEITAEDVIDILIGIFEGEMFQFEDGTILDGTKQAMRVSLFNLTSLLMLIELNLFDTYAPGGYFGERPCDTLKSFVISGKSIELRYIAFASLVTEKFRTISQNLSSLCTPELGGLSEQELVEKVKLGDVEAAVELELVWYDEINHQYENDLLDFDESIQYYRLFVLENTVKYSLLTTAAIGPLFNLYTLRFGDVPLGFVDMQ